MLKLFLELQEHAALAVKTGVVDLAVDLGVHDAGGWWGGERGGLGCTAAALDEDAQAACGELGLQRTVLGDLEVVGAAAGDVGEEGGIEVALGCELEGLADDAQRKDVHGAVVAAFGVATVPAHLVAVDVLLGLSTIGGVPWALVVAAVLEDGVLNGAVVGTWADDGLAGALCELCGDLVGVADADQGIESQLVLIPAVVGREQVAAHVDGVQMFLLFGLLAWLHACEAHSLRNRWHGLAEREAAWERWWELSRKGPCGLDGVVADLVEEGVGLVPGGGGCACLGGRVGGVAVLVLQETVESLADALVLHAASLTSLHLDDERGWLLWEGPQLDAEMVHVGSHACHTNEIIFERILVVVLRAVLAVDGVLVHELAQAAGGLVDGLEGCCAVDELQAGAEIDGVVHRD